MATLVKVRSLLPVLERHGITTRQLSVCCASLSFINVEDRRYNGQGHSDLTFDLSARTAYGQVPARVYSLVRGDCLYVMIIAMSTIHLYVLLGFQLTKSDSSCILSAHFADGS